MNATTYKLTVRVFCVHFASANIQVTVYPRCPLDGVVKYRIIQLTKFAGCLLAGAETSLSPPVKLFY